LSIPIVSIIGKSKSGKTTLLEKLIAELKRRGYRVATIKHHAHPGFDIDKPGKDSWRHAQAGSDHVIVAAPDKLASYRLLERELTLDEIAADVQGVDIILTEGYKRAGKPALEIVRAVNSTEILGDKTQLFALAADIPLDLGVPCFDLDDAAGMVDLIEQRFLVEK
jgi:molybdopterin-guanine dinucleotide biosynthesis protein B